MKTVLYLRLSLLIPIFVWGVCLLFLIIARAFPYLLLSLILLSMFYRSEMGSYQGICAITCRNENKVPQPIWLKKN